MSFLLYTTTFQYAQLPQRQHIHDSPLYFDFDDSLRSWQPLSTSASAFLARMFTAARLSADVVASSFLKALLIETRFSSSCQLISASADGFIPSTRANAPGSTLIDHQVANGPSPWPKRGVICEKNYRLEPTAGMGAVDWIRSAMRSRPKLLSGLPSATKTEIAIFV